jgi:hypothetical protein
MGLSEGAIGIPFSVFLVFTGDPGAAEYLDPVDGDWKGILES